jgi:hypothetical protein
MQVFTVAKSKRILTEYHFLIQVFATDIHIFSVSKASFQLINSQQILLLFNRQIHVRSNKKIDQEGLALDIF